MVNSRVKVFSPHKLVYVVHFKDKSINEKIGLLKSGSVEQSEHDKQFESKILTASGSLQE